MMLKALAAAIFLTFAGGVCAQMSDTAESPASPDSQTDALPPPVAPSVSAESEARAADHRAAPQPPIGVSDTGGSVMGGRVEVVPNECLGLEGRPRERCMQRYSPTGSGASAPRQ
jgi:hypothetical protein